MELPTRTARIALLLAAAPLACAPAHEAGGARAAGRPNVILICMDTVRADHLGCYGYERNPTTPALDALAEESLLFADASATAGWTKPSVPSFLTGTYPAQHGVYEGSARGLAGAATDVLPGSMVTLAEVFADSGLRTAAFVRNAQLKHGNGFEQGFDLYDDRGGDAREIRWKALDWIDGLEAGEGFFLYLHFLDAHWPYDVPDAYATRFAAAEEIALFRGADSRALRDAINDGELELDAGRRRALEDLYDGSIRYLDDQLGALFEGLERRGLREDTILCVVSDHGEEFGEHGRIGHGHGLHENLLRVPWLLHVPGEPATRGRRVERAVSLVDLFPTLLAAAGLGGTPAARAAQGVDLWADEDRASPVFAEHKAPDRYLQSLRVDDGKLVRDFEPPAGAPQDLPPLAPGERWEAEVRRAPEGTLVATQLKPREEPADDPLEIKGVVSGFAEAGFDLVGFPVRSDAATLLVRTEGAESTALADGAAVKVRGSFVEGALVAERIKLYPPDAGGELEVRGPVTAVEGGRDAGRLRIGELWITFDADTTWKGERSSDRARDMDGAQVGEVLARGAAGVRAAGWEVRTALLSIEPDGIESRRAAEGGELVDWNERLDSLTRALLERRAAGAGERATLSDEDLERLRAIGYAE